MVRTSARQHEPKLRSRLETVPEPIMVPAARGRVCAACWIKRGKSKFMSTPALGRPKGAPFRCTTRGRLSLPPSQAWPSSSGVTASGEKAERGLPAMKPKPLASSAGISPRRDTSLTSMTSLMWLPASAAAMPMGTSSSTTATSASKSMPNSSLATGTSSVGARKPSLTAWYMSGSSRKLGGISAPRALRTSSTWLR